MQLSSAIQIAIELSQVADVTLATRQPIRFIQQRPITLIITDSGVR